MLKEKKYVFLVFFILLLSQDLKAQQFLTSEDFLYFFIRGFPCGMPWENLYAEKLLSDDELDIIRIKINTITFYKLNHRKLKVCLEDQNLYNFISQPLKYTTYSKNSFIIYSDDTSCVLEYQNNQLKKLVNKPFNAYFYIYDKNKLHSIITLNGRLSPNFKYGIIEEYGFFIERKSSDKKLKQSDIFLNYSFKLEMLFDTLTGKLQNVNFYHQDYIHYRLTKHSYIFGKNNVDTIIKSYFDVPKSYSLIQPTNNQNLLLKSDTFLLQYQNNLPIYFFSTKKDTLYKFVYSENQSQILLKHIYHYQRGQIFQIDTIEYNDELLYRRVSFFTPFMQRQSISFNYKRKHRFLWKKKKYKDDYIYFSLKNFIYRLLTI